MPVQYGGAPRNFIVGETVHLTSRVSVPGTKTPVNPQSVSLTSLTREDGATVAVTLPMAFTQVRQGEFTLTLETVGLAEGVYQLVVTHSDGPEKVALAVDSFVLQSL